jgi:hypothetical protein
VKKVEKIVRDSDGRQLLVIVPDARKAARQHSDGGYGCY